VYLVLSIILYSKLEITRSNRILFLKIPLPQILSASGDSLHAFRENYLLCCGSGSATLLKWTITFSDPDPLSTNWGPESTVLKKKKKFTGTGSAEVYTVYFGLERTD
jgi:hypothetical protein